MNPARGLQLLAQKLKEPNMVTNSFGAARLSSGLFYGGVNSLASESQDTVQHSPQRKHAPGLHEQHGNMLCKVHFRAGVECSHLLYSNVHTQCFTQPQFILTQKPVTFNTITCSQKCLQGKYNVLIPATQKRTIHTSGQLQHADDNANSTKNSQEDDREKDHKESPPPNEEEDLEPGLEVLTSSTTGSSLKTVNVIPGKGPPPEPPVTCCMTGCVNCVYIAYAEELKTYYSDGGEAARKAIEEIEDPSLKAFLKLELDL
ncbi:hypothetical protein V1264_011356 [Littorina saxatilis]|uniref:Oxidoreductase-like domain-containing protein n=1 Tax=Littorina saxatilis TaxID=31220 RepID=A0AAN9BUY3_9CAEN